MRMKIFVLTTLILAVQACSPRGETYSLQEVLNGAKVEYKAALLRIHSPEVASSLSEVEQLLIKLEGPQPDQEGASAARSVAAALTTLVPKAGYTTRPAMGQIIDQYRVLGEKKAGEQVTQAQLKLLVSRTYSLLASELAGTHFAL